MVVYRYTSEHELKSIIEGNKDKIGNYNNDRTEWSTFNTHKYEDGHKYLHFFKNKKSIDYLKKVRKNPDNIRMFICSYNIPKSVLRRSKGKGEYCAIDHGYDTYDKTITEYAVDVDNFMSEWLVNVEEDITIESQSEK